MVTMTARGQVHTAHNHKFRALSSMAESEPSWFIMGSTPVHVVSEILGFHVLLPGHHFIHIAADGIDFCVVDNGR